MSILSLPAYFSHPTTTSLSFQALLSTPQSHQNPSPPICPNPCPSSSPSVSSLDESVATTSSTAPSAIISSLPVPRRGIDTVGIRTIVPCASDPTCRLSQVPEKHRSLLPSGSSQSLHESQFRNPRRSGRLLISQPNGSTKGPLPASVSALPPPSLLRQSERKTNFVDSLVETAAQIVEAIWPCSKSPCQSDGGPERVIPLGTFIQETLRRSRTSYSTLQVALYYLIVLRPNVPFERDGAVSSSSNAGKALQCGRRMFLSALIVASKYLQDRNYSARAWSKISGLNTAEINTNELIFLPAVNWKLHISEPVFEKWTNIVLKYTPSSSMSGSRSLQETAKFGRLILALSPELRVEDSKEFADCCFSDSSVRPSSEFADPYKRRKSMLLSPPFVGSECGQNLHPTTADYNTNTNTAYHSPISSSPRRRKFREALNISVSSNTAFPDITGDNISQPHRPAGAPPRQAFCSTKRVFETFSESPAITDADLDSDVSSSPESICSVFSKTSRSSSISSISSKTSPTTSSLQIPGISTIADSSISVNPHSLPHRSRFNSKLTHRNGASPYYIYHSANSTPSTEMCAPDSEEPPSTMIYTDRFEVASSRIKRVKWHCLKNEAVSISQYSSQYAVNDLAPPMPASSIPPVTYPRAPNP